MTTFNGIKDYIKRIVKKEEENRGTNIDYNFDEIRFEDESIDHTNNPRVKLSERIVFKCPECNVYTTAGYSTLNKNLYCITETCSYYLKNKKLSIFDINRLVSERNQLLLSKEYGGVRDILEIQCCECSNIQNITFLEFRNGSACSKSDCRLNRMRIDKDSGNVYMKENRMSEKKIDYEYDFKINGFTLLNKIKTQDDEAEIQCSKGHLFSSKFIILKRLLKGDRQKLFCDVCEHEKQWGEIVKYLKDLGLNIISTIDNFNIKSCFKISFNCQKDIHNYKYTKSDLQRKLIDSTFVCTCCERDEKLLKNKVKKQSNDEVIEINEINEIQPEEVEIIIDDETDIKFEPENELTKENYLLKYRKGDIISIPTKDFLILKKKEGIVDEIMDLISDIDILLPESKISLTDLLNDKTPLNEDDNGFYVIPNTNGRKIANYHMQNIMITAKKDIRKLTYIEAWNDLRIRKLLVNRMVKYDVRMNNGTIYGCYGCQYGKVYNFPPNVAKCIYNNFNGKRVLDFCSGYGGRLVGFWYSDAKEYVGIDPHTKLPYNDLISTLKRSGINKKTTMIQNCAEDVDYSKLGMFDLIFTSPPYFSTEIYSDESTQSSVRYPQFDKWLNKFLLATLGGVSSVLLNDGYLIINIKDHKKHKIVDPMIEYVTKELGLDYIQEIELRQSKRYKNTKGECIYVFQKNNGQKDYDIVFSDVEDDIVKDKESCKELCDDIDCDSCFEKSFASHEKGKYWSLKNITSCRKVDKNSKGDYNFVCKNGHKFKTKPFDIVNNNCWCTSCKN